jgi:outer membrane receptor protein involved in Fe transport
LNIESGSGANFLRFSPTTNLNLRAFTEARKLFPRADWLKGARISLTVQNLTNERQRVRDVTGMTPLRYQPGYLDPIGRTVELELRKVF